MKRRQVVLSFLLFLVLLPTTSSAAEPVTSGLVVERPSVPCERELSLSPWVTPIRFPEGSFVESVTMRSLPVGSLVTNYTGFHGFAFKQARSQTRRLVRQAISNGWYVLDDNAPTRRTIFEQIDSDWVGTNVNGAWWTRSWLDSLPPEKGGAPAVPYVHTFGEDTEFRAGPISVTNTFKVRFDCIGFFELNPDPVSPEHTDRHTPIALDVRAAQEADIGTTVRFNVRPNFRLGMPRGGDLASVLRGLSVRATFEVYHHRQEVIAGEVEIKWCPEDGLVALFEAELVAW